MIFDLPAQVITYGRDNFDGFVDVHFDRLVVHVQKRRARMQQ